MRSGKRSRKHQGGAKHRTRARKAQPVQTVGRHPQHPRGRAVS